MAKELFTENQRQQIQQAVKNAEKNTSGEVRVHIDLYCKEDVLDRAAFVFEKLEMHKTELRNAVLFYLATEDHKFAILGDAGINQKVPKNFWDEIKLQMLTYFQERKFTEGLCRAISQAGEQLKAHFPYKHTDSNELSDEITFGRK